MITPIRAIITLSVWLMLMATFVGAFAMIQVIAFGFNPLLPEEWTRIIADFSANRYIIDTWHESLFVLSYPIGAISALYFGVKVGPLALDCAASMEWPQDRASRTELTIQGPFQPVEFTRALRAATDEQLTQLIGEKQADMRRFYGAALEEIERRKLAIIRVEEYVRSERQRTNRHSDG